MTSQQVNLICGKRFDGWRQRFVGHNATPQVCIGIVNQTPEPSAALTEGQLVVLAVDEKVLTHAVLAAMLRHAADLLEQQP